MWVSAFHQCVRFKTDSDKDTTLGFEWKLEDCFFHCLPFIYTYLWEEVEKNAILKAGHMVVQWLLTVSRLHSQTELFQETPDQSDMLLAPGESRNFLIFLCAKMWLEFCQRQCLCRRHYFSSGLAPEGGVGVVSSVMCSRLLLPFVLFEAGS